MYQLIYTSVAVKNFSQDELISMLKSFRARNKSNQISGILVYNDREFIQLLEGRKEIIHQLYERIRQDPRHQHVKTFHEAPVFERHFSDWSMGFINADNTRLEDISGFSNVIKEGASALGSGNQTSVGTQLFISLCSMMSFDDEGTMQA